MNVAELIEWLKGQEQSAIVEVVVHKDDDGLVGTTYPDEFDPTVHAKISAFSGETFLLLGEYQG